MQNFASADHALFEGRVQGLAAVCYEGERPPQGLTGLLDWRFAGMISSALQAGLITGKAGECVYLPATRGGKTYHVLLVGGGPVGPGGKRGAVPRESLNALSKNLSGLRLSGGGIGVSASDLGAPSAGQAEQWLKGAPHTALE